ncbi:MAG: hypothetical protein KDB68_05370 [Planctomycetes bacterium]|nr:hypothetical protein [Planctomycetota bacterium]
MRKVLTVAVAALLLLVSAHAEDNPAPKLGFKTSGDSVYDFKTEVLLENAPDTSTPAGVVLYWSGIANSTKNYDDPPTAPEIRYDELKSRAMVEFENQLLSKALGEAVSKLRNETGERESRYQSKRSAAVIDSEEKQEDGSVVIVTSQKRESRYKNNDDEWETSEEQPTYFRYQLLTSEDGTWRINRVERGRAPRDAKESEKTISWDSYRNSGLEFAYEFSKSEDAELTKPELKTGTPEEAALSFANNLRSFHDDIDMHFFGVLWQGLSNATERLFTKEYIEGVHKSSDERSAKYPPKEKHLASVEEVKDKADNAATVVFKLPDSKASDKLVVKVVKEGESWRVNEVGTLRDAGTEKESYEPKEDIYRRW